MTTDHRTQRSALTDLASGLLMGLGACIMALGGLGWLMSGTGHSQCSDALIGALNASQCGYYDNIYNLSMAGLFIGALAFLAGLIMNFARR